MKWEFLTLWLECLLVLKIQKILFRISVLLLKLFPINNSTMNRMIACLCLSIFICFAASAQQNKISGTVKDAKGIPVDAVTVQVLNTNLSTVTDLTGAFELVNVPPGKVSLRFTAVDRKSVV